MRALLALQDEDRAVTPNLNEMGGADFIVAGADWIRDYNLLSSDTNAAPVLDIQDDILNPAVTRAFGTTEATFSRLLDTSDASGDKIIGSRSKVLWAQTLLSDWDTYHGDMCGSVVIQVGLGTPHTIRQISCFDRYRFGWYEDTHAVKIEGPYIAWTFSRNAIIWFVIVSVDTPKSTSTPFSRLASDHMGSIIVHRKGTNRESGNICTEADMLTQQVGWKKVIHCYPEEIKIAP